MNLYVIQRATGGGLEVVFKVLTVSKEPKCAGIAQVLCIEYFRYIGGVPSRAFHFEKINGFKLSYVTKVIFKVLSALTSLMPFESQIHPSARGSEVLW